MRFILFIIFFRIAVSFGQNVPEEANRYYYRGIATVEMAKSSVEFEAAIREFEQAASLAPEWPEVYYALGQAYEKIEKYAEAIDSYKKYITLAPAAANAGTVKILIYKLDYKLEKSGEKQKIIALLTKWNTAGSAVKFTKTGGCSAGVYTLKQFFKIGDNLQAYIPCSFKDSPLRSKLILDEQTVPVDFDGRIMRFKYDYYNCPTLPEFQYCHSEVKITAEIISVSPLKFKVKEEWKNKKNSETTIYDAEWQFSE